MGSIRHFRELDVYQLAMAGAMEIFELSKKFPTEERYSLTDQVRRSSRSVCANIAESWRKGVTPTHLSASLVMQNLKPLKRRFGSNLPSSADTLTNLRRMNLKHSMKTFKARLSACWLAPNSGGSANVSHLSPPPPLSASPCLRVSLSKKGPQCVLNSRGRCCLSP